MKLVCLGDSMTYGYGVSRADVWTRLAERECGVTFVNRGVNGNTTGGMLADLRWELERHLPDAVFLMGGANNLLFGGSTDGAKADIGAMAHLLAARGLPVVIGIPPDFCPPIREDWAAFADIERAEPLWSEYALWLYRFCETFGFPVLDFRGQLPVLAAEQNRDLQSLYLDGLHLNAEGQRLMARIAAETIRRIGWCA
jgi:acyl-CoA thioesterase-1